MLAIFQFIFFCLLTKVVTKQSLKSESKRSFGTDDTQQQNDDVEDSIIDSMRGGGGSTIRTNQGTLVRTRVDEVSLSSRNTQGVRVIRVKQDEHVIGVERIEEADEVVSDENV